MKNLIKSRRGIAIEMAIGAMFIMIALSIVLISISGMQTRHMKSDLNDFNEKIDLYEITDYIIDNPDSNNYNNIYSITKTDNEVDETITYTVKDIENNDDVLTFTVKGNEITSWGK